MGVDLGETNRRVIREFRAGGEIEGMHRDRLVLLTTTGARTGERRTTPMMFHREGQRLLVVASNAGAPRHPDWYHNVVANPRVTVEVGDETFEATAVPLAGEDRERTWAMLKERYPFFAGYEAEVARTIAVVALVRLDDDAPARRDGAD
jgi:deazaflavin-dependent oxidoreductase (nitroreductase family)